MCYTAAKGVYNDTPKTNASYRVIPVPGPAMALLLELREDQRQKQDSKKLIKFPNPELVAADDGYVFTQRKGSLEPMHPQSPDRFCTKFGKKYGIKDFHPHKLRHTFASVAIAHGADIASVSEILGHNNKGTTLKMYTHSNMEAMRKTSNIFNAAVKQA